MKKTVHIDDDTLELIIQAFPHLKHDAIPADLLRVHFGECRRLDEGDRERFRQRLVNAYHLSDEGDGPPLSLVVLQSFLKSIEMSKYGRDGRLEAEDLEPLGDWLRSLKTLDEVGFCRGKADMLLFLLINVKVDLSECVLFGFFFRKILQILTQGGESIQRKDWNYHQLPLRLLLSRGLPGHDILIKQDILEGHKKVDEVGTKCPIEGLYPFQLAATPKDYLVAYEPAQLSQVYELMRVDPSRVVESHSKRGAENTAAEKQALDEQRSQTDHMPKRKTQRIN